MALTVVFAAFALLCAHVQAGTRSDGLIGLGQGTGSIAAQTGRALKEEGGGFFQPGETELIGYGVGSTAQYLANGGTNPTTTSSGTSGTPPGGFGSGKAGSTSTGSGGNGAGGGINTNPQLGAGGGKVTLPAGGVTNTNPNLGAGGGKVTGTFGQPKGGDPTVAVGKITYSYGGEPTAAHATINGDPMITGFDGRAFEFMGEPGKFYSLLSEQRHQVSTRLKLGVMFDHNGTYMDGVALQYLDHTIAVEITPEDGLAVTLDGELLGMAEGQAEREVLPYIANGELLVLWQLHRPDLGNAVEISTDLLQVLVWLTPAGTMDEGGVEQPAYLNIDTTLLGPPAGNSIQGIVGETYGRLLAGEDAMTDPAHPLYLPNDNQFRGKGAEEEYEVDGFFGQPAFSLFGREGADGPAQARRLAETGLAFPLHASGRTTWIAHASTARAQASFHATGGRKGRFV